MSVEIGILLALVGGAIGVATFLIGRQSAAKNDGERWGELKADIRHMKEDISEIKTSLEKSEICTKESIRRLHERIDEHMRQEHGMTMPKREG